MTDRPRFGWLLLALCAAAAAVRAVLLREFWVENPFALFPYSDGDLYWTRAGEMASGHWLPDHPFLIAPLYPLWLGALRWLGGGLLVLYVAQTALHLATGALLGLAARARFGDRAALLASALFFLLSEPALFATRVLSVTLQCFLLTLLWWDWARLSCAERAGLLHAARVGAWSGLLALAFPPALLLVPVLAFSLLRSPGPRRRALVRAGLGAGAALLVIAPATLHNALRSGELVPITAHAGLTLAQGNGPGSVGIYTPLDGVSTSIRDQHRDAARHFEAEHGRAGSWSEVDAHFRQQVVSWWLSHPFDAAALFARKLFWFAAGHSYDNVAVFALEREQGLGRAWLLVPVAIPWLLGAALLGAMIAGRDGWRAFPELALAALPLLVCVVFYHSARYRLVGVPVLCGLVALAVLRWRSLRWPPGAVAALAILPLPILAASAAFGLEDLDFMRSGYAVAAARHHVKSGAALEAAGGTQRAREHYRRALHGDPGNARAWRHLYNLQASSGDFEAAIATLEGFTDRTPEDVPARLALAWLLASCPDASLRRPDDAWRQAREALRRSGGDDPEALMVLALSEAARGRFAEALDHVARGRVLARERGEAELLASLESLEAVLASQRVVRSQPRLLRITAG